MKKRFTEEQIIGVLKESEAGLKPAELCRKHGNSEATFRSEVKGIAAGTRFADIPDDWRCPLCDVGRAEFAVVEY
jgi:putative transposase